MILYYGTISIPILLYFITEPAGLSLPNRGQSALGGILGGIVGALFFDRNFILLTLLFFSLIIVVVGTIL